MSCRQLAIDGLPALVDTAGLRETDDLIEAEGVRRARAELAQIGCCWSWTTAAAPVRTTIACSRRSATAARSPTRSISAARGGGDSRAARRFGSRPRPVTASTRWRHICVAPRVAGDSEPDFVARRRHLEALVCADAALDRPTGSSMPR